MGPEAVCEPEFCAIMPRPTSRHEPCQRVGDDLCRIPAEFERGAVATVCEGPLIRMQFRSWPSRLANWRLQRQPPSQSNPAAGCLR